MNILPKTGGPVLVTGGTGQLALALSRHGGARICRVGRPEFDFDHAATLDAVFEKAAPSAVINAAAWTAVDLAETEPEAAARANATGPAHLARLCATRNIPFFHVSTDYVFDGEKGAPYVETDAISPCTVYGRTKAEGEQAVLAAWSRSLILRTAWVYSADGRNFVKTMLNAGLQRPSLRVVGDQVGNPTCADDLAKAILSCLAIIEKDGWEDHYGGIFHACAQGETSWYGLATAALEQAARHGRPMPEITAIRTQDWPTPAKRPMDSRMECTKLSEVFNVTLPRWEDSLINVVDQLCSAT
jgi:dTDP-4-dehydrorhamnose reductase